MMSLSGLYLYLFVALLVFAISGSLGMVMKLCCHFIVLSASFPDPAGSTLFLIALGSL